MNDAPSPTSLERAEKLQGMGCKRKRVEDVRFTQGRGNYVDDIKLPGMLHGDFHRSSHAHARIVKIDTSKAKAVPGVVAVLTAEDLKGVNLAWMPTLAGDVQMVLADGKVLFQNQEIAFVVATDRYAPPTPQIWSRSMKRFPSSSASSEAMDQDNTILRETSRTRRMAPMEPEPSNHIFNSRSVTQELTDAAFVKAEVGDQGFTGYQRHPCPLETCQCVVSFNKITGDLTIYSTFRPSSAPWSLCRECPEAEDSRLSPIGGGSATRSALSDTSAPRSSIVTSRQMGRGPDREPSTTSLRDYHARLNRDAQGQNGTRAYPGRSRRVQTRDPSKWPQASPISLRVL